MAELGDTDGRFSLTEWNPTAQRRVEGYCLAAKKDYEVQQRLTETFRDSNKYLQAGAVESTHRRKEAEKRRVRGEPSFSPSLLVGTK